MTSSIPFIFLNKCEDHVTYLCIARVVALICADTNRSDATCIILRDNTSLP